MKTMDLKRICVFAVVSLVFVMIFCRATSPLYDSVGFDSIIYRIMGQRVALGDGVIYSELFDNKGPYLFMIQALGFIIDKEWGIMLLQVLNFIVILELLYRIGRFMGGNTFSVYMSLIVTVLFLSFTIDSGNLTEDWSMAFMLYPLYLLLRDIGNGTDSYQRDIALSGVCFGVVSLIRVNNGYIIGCIILYYIILYLRRKEYRTLSKAVLLVIVGAIVAWIPVVVYLISIGGIRAVSDMVYAVFVYNVKYNIVWPTIAGDASVVRNILMLFPCLFFLFYSIFLYRKSRLFAGICGIIATVCIMLLVKSSGYNHYFILELPVVFLCTIGVLELCEDMKLKWLMSFIVLAVMFIPVIYCAGYSYYVKLYFENCFVTPQESQRNVSPIMELVTEEERDSIYCYRVNNYVFDEIYRAEVMPLGKYFYLQEQLCIVDDKIRNEINNFVSTTPPLWILSGNYDLPKNPVVDISKYTEIYSDDNVVLLRRKQE